MPPRPKNIADLVAAPSLSQDPAWRAQQGRVLVLFLVGCGLCVWLGRRGQWVLAIGAVWAVGVAALRELRVLEHMARVTPPTGPVDDASIIAPSAGDLLGAPRPVYTLGPGGVLLEPGGSPVTVAQVAAAAGEIALSGDQSAPEYWRTVEALNSAGVHVLGA